MDKAIHERRLRKQARTAASELLNALDQYQQVIMDPDAELPKDLRMVYQSMEMVLIALDGKRILSAKEQDVLLALHAQKPERIALIDFQTADNEEALPDLMDKELVEEKDGTYALTRQGEGVAEWLNDVQYTQG